jgi:hypothetical protein
MNLRSPFYRQFLPSIALLSPMGSAFDRRSIGFDRPSSIPPIPPSAIEPRFGPWMARLGSDHGKGRKDLVTTDALITFTLAMAWLGIFRCRRTDTNRYDFARSHAPAASQPSWKQHQTSHKPLQHNERHLRRHLFDDHRKGIYARGLPHSLTFLGRNGECARKRSAGQALGETEALRISNPEFSAGPLTTFWKRPGAGGKIARCQKSSSPESFAALSKKPVASPPQRPGCLFRRAAAQEFRTGAP